MTPEKCQLRSILFDDTVQSACILNEDLDLVCSHGQFISVIKQKEYLPDGIPEIQNEQPELKSCN